MVTLVDGFKHWRYVGTAVATDMKAKGIETLEQYYRVEGGDYRQ